MALTDTAIRNSKPKEKPYKVTDSQGLYLRKIVQVWRKATEQARTRLTGLSSVKMNLKNDVGDVVQVAMPDAPGEDWRPSPTWISTNFGRRGAGSIALRAGRTN